MDSITVDLDFYPANVTLPSGGRFKISRLFVANGEVIVYANEGDGITEVFRRGLLSAEGHRRRGYNLQTETGMVKVVESAGCGCSDPLKRYNPWPGVHRRMGSL